MIREIAPDEFTAERLLPQFQAVEGLAYGPNRCNPDYFFPSWQKLMASGIARTWEGRGCSLGAIFVPDTFRGSQMALVVFWASTKEHSPKDAVGLLDLVEKVATQNGCKRICSAAHAFMNHYQMCQLYQRKGYQVLETTFSKELTNE